MKTIAEHAQSFRTRFSLIDKTTSDKSLAIKKKKDIRRLAMTSSSEDKKAALDIVWAEELAAGKV